MCYCVSIREEAVSATVLLSRLPCYLTLVLGLAMVFQLLADRYEKDKDKEALLLVLFSKR